MNSADLTERQRLALIAALKYAQVNVDDVNDSFYEEDEDGDEDTLQVAGVRTPPFDGDEFEMLAELLTE